MFPKISDLFNYLLGTRLNLPVQTYGFFLALAFLTAGLILRSELRRKEKNGQLLPVTQKVIKNKPVAWHSIFTGALISAVIGFKFFGIITDYQVFQANPQKYLTSGQGNLLAAILIFLISCGHSMYRNHKLKKAGIEVTEETIHPYQQTWGIVIIAIISALVGSKLFDIIDNFGDFLRDPVGNLISFSGLTFYGGLIVTVITLMYYMRVIHLDWKHVIDATAPAIILGYAIGRMGCHLSGDGCWGVINTLPNPGWLPDWLWSSQYPHNVIREGITIPGCSGTNCRMLEFPVWPTSLYESLISVLFFAVLWGLRKRIQAPVTLFGIFLVMNGVERFLIEKIRINHRFSFLGMHPTQAEIISFLLVITGILIIWYYTRRFRQLNADQGILGRNKS